MESLSGNQVKDLKELYASIYKSDDQEISETTANLQGLDKKMLNAMKGEPITINLSGGGTTKIYPGSSNYEKAKKGENFSIDPSSERGKINVTKNDSGKLKAKVEIVDTSKKNEVKPNEKNEVIPEPKISPATFKTNQRQSRELVSTGKLKDTDLNKFSRSSTYTADDGKTQVDRSTVNTIAKFDMGPNIKKGDKLGVISGNLRKKYDLKASSFKSEAYDLVLDYVLSEGHADTVEEAHYVMTQMDADTIQTIVEFIGGQPGDGYIGHPRLDIKNPLNPPKKELKKTTGKDSNKGVQGLGNRATDIENMIKSIP